MDVLIKIIHCCNKEEVKNNQSNCEIEVPFNKNDKIQHKTVIDKSKFTINNESLNLKSTEINTNTLNTLNITNNTSTLNITNNTSNNNIIDETYNNFNNNENKIKNKIQKEILFSSSRNGIIFSKCISNNNNNIESKKMSESLISKSNISNHTSNKGTIFTLNDLILINQNQEEEKDYEIGSKLLLSGELFFYKEIIISTNGIKNSLRKEKKDDHVFFGLKNILNSYNDSYNDLIINFFYQKEDSDLIETNTGRVFEIYYNKKGKEYMLHFLHPNLILYYKINNFVYFSIGKEYYFLLGNIFMSICVQKISPIEKIIDIQIEIENEKPYKYTFNQNQAPIKIGRGRSEVNIISPSISKKHGIIEYSKISQTFYYKDMGSTNGSILIIRAGDILKLKGEMNYRLEDVPFKIQEIP